MKLPCDECKGKCCTFPTFSRKEFDIVKAKYGVPFFAKVADLGTAVVLQDNCPYLQAGKCSIYEDRPRGCKDYGVVPQLPCMFLYPKEAVMQVHAAAEHMERNFK